MVAKKKSSRKKAASRARKPVSRKKVVKKKVAKKRVTKKKVTRKKAPKKKVTKKKVIRKKAPKKKVTKKKVTRKKKAGAKSAPKRVMKKSNGRGNRRRKAGSDEIPIHGISPYRSRKGEEYMNEPQLEHFRLILLAWKAGLMQEVDRTVHHMQDEASNFPDPNDRATQESDFGLELRTRDRERKLLKKIASAMQRIDDGSYGYCEETGDEIGLQRLEARPVATLCVEAQERRELAERQFSDRDDQYR